VVGSMLLVAVDVVVCLGSRANPHPSSPFLVSTVESDGHSRSAERRRICVLLNRRLVHRVEPQALRPQPGPLCWYNV
jgi:hypothetical protein